MVIDYKDVSFSFKVKKRRQLIKRIILALAVVLLISIFFFINNALVGGDIQTIQGLLLQGKVGEAQTAMEDVDGSMFHKVEQQELKALIFLFNRQYSKAKDILAGLKNKQSSLDEQKFLTYFSQHGRCRALEMYTDYLLPKGKDLLFYKILARTSFFDATTSNQLIAQLPPAEKEKHSLALSKIEKINEQLQSGKIDYIFDSNGIPLAYYDINEKKTVPRVPGFDFSAFDPGINDSIKFFSLTLDSKIQLVLHQLFHSYHGSFLLLDLEGGGIVAAYSKHLPSPSLNRDQDQKPNVNAVFSEEYIPASVIKVVTLFAFLESDGNNIFPVQCEGNMELDGKLFYDWRKHGQVSTFNEALAVSCNIVFARMGLDLGFTKLSTALDTFFFNHPPLKDLFLEFHTGRTRKQASSDYTLARLSVGLTDNGKPGKDTDTDTGNVNDNGPLITTTTFHNALIAATIAYDGTISSPYLINNIKSVLDIGYYNHEEKRISTVEANRIFFKIKEAMKDVVESPQGLGRRAKVDFTRVAAKTGTFGNSRRGFDAIMMGFFPAEKAKYAFAFILQRAGKAEFQGARFLKEFLVNSPLTAGRSRDRFPFLGE